MSEAVHIMHVIGRIVFNIHKLETASKSKGGGFLSIKKEYVQVALIATEPSGRPYLYKLPELIPFGWSVRL